MTKITKRLFYKQKTQVGISKTNGNENLPSLSLNKVKQKPFFSSFIILMLPMLLGN
jgi:hypothetical protein